MVYDALFSTQRLDDLLRATTERVRDMADGIDKDQFLASSVDQIVAHVVDQLRMEPLELFEDRAQLVQDEVQVDVSRNFDRGFAYVGRREPAMFPGIRATILYPFHGDIGLWRLQPNPCTMSFPKADVLAPRGASPGMLVVKIEQPHDVPLENIQQKLGAFLDLIRSHLEHQRAQVERFNENLPGNVLTAVNARRERLERQEGLSALLEIPLKHSDEAPPIEPLRVERKIVTPLADPPRSGFKPEPGILPEVYGDILTIIRHEGRTFETTPTTFAVHDEEGLRDILLAHLNGHFPGGATGETFRKLGKTDIRIEDKERAAFVAECAVWRGPKYLAEKIDQLLGYLTWRDCKAALIIFNKKVAGFTGLLEKTPEICEEHSLHIRQITCNKDGEWRFEFRSPEDEERRITVHVFLIDLYVA